MIFIFCGKHPLLLTKIQVSDTGLLDPLVYFVIDFSTASFSFTMNAHECSKPGI